MLLAKHLTRSQLSDRTDGWQAISHFRANGHRNSNVSHQSDVHVWREIADLARILTGQGVRKRRSTSNNSAPPVKWASAGPKKAVGAVGAILGGSRFPRRRVSSSASSFSRSTRLAVSSRLRFGKAMLRHARRKHSACLPNRARCRSSRWQAGPEAALGRLMVPRRGISVPTPPKPKDGMLW